MERRVILKRADGCVILECMLPVDAPLKQVWEQVQGSEETHHLIFRGQLLSGEWLTLAEVFGDVGAPIVYVVPKKSRESLKPAPVTPQSELKSRSAPQVPSAQHAVGSGETLDEPKCRICFMGEIQEDRLFRPCLCRGSVGLVHTGCLNAWRERAENPELYFKCANCGYEYRIARASFARLLSSERFVTLVAGLHLISTIGLVSCLSLALFPQEASDFLFGVLEYDPPDVEYPFVRHVLFGMCCVGLVGFAIHLAELIEMIRSFGTVESAFALGLTLTANGGRGIRVFAACGLAVVFKLLFKSSERFSRRLLSRFGERVLEVE